MPIPLKARARPFSLSDDRFLPTIPGPAQRNSVQNLPGYDVAGMGRFFQASAPAIDSSQPPTSHPILLMMSEDLYLSQSREPFLRAAGFQVVTAHGDYFEGDSLSNALAAVLFCQTIAAERALACAEFLRRCDTPIRTLRLTRSPHLEQKLFDRIVQSPVPPEVLADETLRLRRIIGNERSTYRLDK